MVDIFGSKTVSRHGNAKYDREDVLCRIVIETQLWTYSVLHWCAQQFARFEPFIHFQNLLDGHMLSVNSPKSALTEKKHWWMYGCMDVWMRGCMDV